MEEWDIGKGPYTKNQLYTNRFCDKMAPLVKFTTTDPPPHRFWICRALESFVRNASSRAAQVFLLRRNLLPLALDFNAAESHSVVIQEEYGIAQ